MTDEIPNEGEVKDPLSKLDEEISELERLTVAKYNERENLARSLVLGAMSGRVGTLSVDLGVTDGAVWVRPVVLVDVDVEGSLYLASDDKPDAYAWSFRAGRWIYLTAMWRPGTQDTLWGLCRRAGDDLVKRVGFSEVRLNGTVLRYVEETLGEMSCRLDEMKR